MNAHTGKTKSFIDTLDNYSVQERAPNKFGALISLGILPSTLTYAVILYLQLSGEMTESNNIVWSMSVGPYPLDFECTAETGCIYSHAEETMVSGQNDVTKAKCHTMQPGERKKLQVFYAGGQTPMVSIYTANNSSKVASIWSEANHWHVSDIHPIPYPNGVFPMPTAMYAASHLANYVVTTNATLKGLGRTRHEWFFTHINGDGAPQPFVADPCISAVDEKYTSGIADVQHTRIRMAPSFNEIIVDKRFNFLDYIGTASGMHGLFISAGAIVLSLIELEVWAKFISRRVTNTISYNFREEEGDVVAWELDTIDTCTKDTKERLDG